MIHISELATALDLGDHELVSLVGGGGKTTSLFALGAQLSGTRIMTTTTRMGRDNTGGNVVLFSPSDEQLDSVLHDRGAVLAWRSDAAHKAIGVSAQTCDRWFDLADQVIVEADGSRKRPFKAPGPFEPVIPSRTTIVVACIGASALGRVIADQCQRPLRVAAVAGCSPYQRLTPTRAAAVIRSSRGTRKDCPSQARFSVVVHNVTADATSFVEELAEDLAGDAPVVAVKPFTDYQTSASRVF